MMRITAFYASLLTLLYLYLSVRVIGWRRQQRVEIGHAEDAQLLRRMRVHANFAEYAPFALLLMALAEAGPATYSHASRRPDAGRRPRAARLRAVADTANPEVQSVGDAANVHGDGHRRTDCFSLSALSSLV